MAALWILSNIGALWVGWGADAAALLATPPRAGLVVVWCVGGMLTSVFTGRLSVAVWAACIERRVVALERTGWQRVKIAVFGAAWAAFLVVLAKADRTGRWALPETLWPFRYIGLLAFVAGGGVRLWAIRAREAADARHVLATSGPYSRIRHPEYLGILLVLLGLSLVFRSVLGLAVWCVWVGVILVRIPREEREIIDGPDALDYENHRARTARLLPGVY